MLGGQMRGRFGSARPSVRERLGNLGHKQLDNMEALGRLLVKEVG
jgi:hypothetical protein